MEIYSVLCDFKNPVRYPLAIHDYWKVDFSRVDLRELNLRDLRFSHCKFKYSVLDRLNLAGSVFGNCDFSYASFRRANLCGCNLETANTLNVDFSGSSFDENTRLPFSRVEAIERGMIYRRNFQERRKSIIFPLNIAEGGVANS